MKHIFMSYFCYQEKDFIVCHGDQRRTIEEMSKHCEDMGLDFQTFYSFLTLSQNIFKPKMKALDLNKYVTVLYNLGALAGVPNAKEYVYNNTVTLNLMKIFKVEGVSVEELISNFVSRLISMTGLKRKEYKEEIIRYLSHINLTEDYLRMLTPYIRTNKEGFYIGDAFSESRLVLSSNSEFTTYYESVEPQDIVYFKSDIIKSGVI